jgi:hypothetical protein
MSAFERFLVRLDSWPFDAILRAILGLAIVPVFRLLSGGHAQVWTLLALFVGLLICLRVGPAVVRHVLPFSDEAKKAWSERRNLAKQYDSYQWQKLFWIGLGLLPYNLLGEGPKDGELALTLICLFGGSAGLLFWHRSQHRPLRQVASTSRQAASA